MRDPRIDPQPGDVFRVPGGGTRVVWKMNAGGIAYRCLRANGEDFGPGWCKRDFWQTKMADAEIVTVAEVKP